MSLLKQIEKLCHEKALVTLCNNFCLSSLSLSTYLCSFSLFLNYCIFMIDLMLHNKIIINRPSAIGGVIRGFGFSQTSGVLYSISSQILRKLLRLKHFKLVYYKDKA